MARQANKLEPQFVPVPAASNTAAVVVSYFPDSLFERHLEQLDGQFDAVFWVDNTPRQSGEAPGAPNAAIRCSETLKSPPPFPPCFRNPKRTRSSRKKSTGDWRLPVT